MKMTIEKAFKIDHWHKQIDDDDHQPCSDFMLKFSQNPALFLEAIRELEKWLEIQANLNRELDWDMCSAAELELFSVLAYNQED
jgi:hypothetical protein